jgi:hypothetical protein
MTWLIIPFIIQSVVIGIDEYVFHLKRGLPKWERLGHPLDTLTVVICLMFALCMPYSAAALKWYIGLAILSCIMVTKDEFIHKHHCPASEQWLHAFLFLNHPILLTCIALIWRSPTPFLHYFLMTQTFFAVLFFLYQAIYWNLIWKPKQE